jgi:hypothetical protein
MEDGVALRSRSQVWLEIPWGALFGCASAPSGVGRRVEREAREGRGESLNS